jgi:hypothetical protein
VNSELAECRSKICGRAGVKRVEGVFDRVDVAGVDPGDESRLL